MKKSHKFNEMSDKVCDVKRCKKKIKARLVETKAANNITKCFAHHVEAEGRRHHIMRAV